MTQPKTTLTDLIIARSGHLHVHEHALNSAKYMLEWRPALNRLLQAASAEAMRSAIGRCRTLSVNMLSVEWPDATRNEFRKAALDTIGIALALFMAVCSMFLLAGCGGHNTTTIYADEPVLEQHDSSAYATEPLAQFRDIDVEPVPERGFRLSEMHGMYGRVPHDLLHTVSFKDQFPDDFMLAAIDAMEDISSQQQFQVVPHNGTERPDVVVARSAKPLSPACTGEQPGAQCWAGSAGCRNSEYLGNGFYDCRQWEINMNVPNMRAWAELADKPLSETFATLFEHELGHTLGLHHDDDEGGGLMRSLTFIADANDMRPVLSSCHRAILSDYARVDDPGLFVVETPDRCL